ncbi:MAG: phosphatidate cytidylyltransferase, partial [Calditrichaeota bacterium]|nr:phosphatidate cytidylyltransferase [Calditrichota bacterium]
AAWGIPLLLVLTWLGGWWTALLIGGISMMGLSEYYTMQKELDRKPAKVIGLIIGLALIFVWKINVWEINFARIDIIYFHWVIIAACLILMVYMMMRGRSHLDFSATMSGLIYIPLLMGCFISVRDWDGGAIDNEGRWLAFGIWGAIWICDTAAYFGGKLLGKHKLAPTISPNKTIEGFLFGFAGSVIFSIVWWRLGLIEFDVCVVLAIAGGLFGQVGDLAESALKREAQVKDSSALLPGHGGILDRFDSLLFTAPVMAMYLVIRPELLFYLQ